MALRRAGRRDPGGRVVGRAVHRPVLERDHERVLERLLGEIEVAECSDEAREHEPRLLTEHLLDRRSRVAHTPSLAGAAATRVGRPAASAERPDRPDLDRSRDRPGHPRRDLDRGVEVGAVDEVVAAQLLLGLGERPVGDDHLVAAHAPSSPSRSIRARRPRGSVPLFAIDSVKARYAS